MKQVIRCVWCREILERAINHYLDNGLCCNCVRDIDGTILVPKITTDGVAVQKG